MTASKPKRREWTEAEIVVLCAVFLSREFSSGDDERPECRRIAAAFNRSPATIDRQWRNVKDYLANFESKKTGSLVKYWADIALERPSVVRSLAIHYSQINNWPLHDLMEIN